MSRQHTKVTAEVWGLRAKFLVYSLVQLAGWAVILFGIYTMFSPSIAALGYETSLPTVLSASLPTLSFIEGLGVLTGGLIVVWISTANWF